ncbi:hypothetical protein AAC03nite_17960 [Alicyclobacillus acidoterrestris]|nr:hypothetical protein AAC03nite_17960 [Alicyclobacillus acidoterrestris]
MYSMTRNTAVADDLSQEVFIQAYQHLSQFRETSSMKTWLFTIAKHKCIDYFRSAFVRRVTFHARMDDVSDDSVEERVIASEQRNAVWAALFQLKPDAREVVLLHTKEDMTFKEVGQVLGISETAARVKYHRAVQKLQRMLGEGGRRR